MQHPVPHARHRNWRAEGVPASHRSALTSMYAGVPQLAVLPLVQRHPHGALQVVLHLQHQPGRHIVTQSQRRCCKQSGRRLPTNSL